MRLAARGNFYISNFYGSGLLLDLDNGGTLTMYLDGKPCGTIAVGLDGPLYPCIMPSFKGKVVKIHTVLVPPQ